MSHHDRYKVPGAVAILEDAVALLRRAPAGALFCHFAGVLPFAVALLYFVTDMRHSAFASHRLPEAALGLSFAYIWMKWWQMRSAQLLRACAAGGAVQRVTAKVVWRGLASQAFIHGLGLIGLPLSLLTVVGWGWAFAFVQSATVVGDGADDGSVWARSARLAVLWPGQNLVLMALLCVVWVVVFVNVFSTVALVPLLGRVAGVHNQFTLSGYGWFNGTTAFASALLAWCCIDPLVKAAYVLRVYHGEARATGQDLLAELAGLRRQAMASAAPRGAMLVVLAVVSLALSQGMAASPPPAPALSVAPAVTPAELDRAIGEVVAGPLYAWRLPRDLPAPPPTVSADPVRGAVEALRRLLGKAADRAGAVARRIRSWLRTIMPVPRKVRRAGGIGIDWMGTVNGVLYLLLALLLLVLVIALARGLRDRHGSGRGGAGASVRGTPDPEDEAVGAEALPADEWMALAVASMGDGRYRVAVRALFLSTLATLSATGFVTLAGCRSNGEYERQLVARAGRVPRVVPAFAQSRAYFEEVWYGDRQPDGATTEQFLRHTEALCAHARTQG